MAKKTIHTLEEIYPESAVAAQFQGLHNIKRYEGIGSFELCGI